MSEQEKERQYLAEADLIEKPSFARSNIEGYVEEEVDVFVRAAREKFMGFANDYNTLLHQNLLDKAEVNDLRQRAETLTQKLEEARTNNVNDDNYQQLLKLQEEYNQLVSESQARLSELAELKEAAREKDQRIADLEEQLTAALTAADEAASAAEDTLVEFADLEPVAEEAPVENKDVATQAHALLEAAAEEASNHVTRTAERVKNIEAAAHAEAADIVRDAHAEAAEAIQIRDEARDNAVEIIDKMKNFYTAQLTTITNTLGSVGYNPSVEDDGSNLNNLELQGDAAVQAEAEESDLDLESISAFEDDSNETPAAEETEEVSEAVTADYDDADTVAMDVVADEADDAVADSDDTATVDELAEFLKDENNQTGE